MVRNPMNPFSMDGRGDGSCLLSSYCSDFVRILRGSLKPVARPSGHNHSRQDRRAQDADPKAGLRGMSPRMLAADQVIGQRAKQTAPAQAAISRSAAKASERLRLRPAFDPASRPAKPAPRGGSSGPRRARGLPACRPAPSKSRSSLASACPACDRASAASTRSAAFTSPPARVRNVAAYQAAA